MCLDVLRLGGGERLVRLCRDPRERGGSDAVLVAALAVLRRIKNQLDSDEVSLVFDELDAADLVGPKLVDSFLECSNNTSSNSNKQESYV